MSAVTSEDVAAETSTAPVPRIKPFWVRPFACVLVVAAHGLLLFGYLQFAEEKITPLQEISVEIPQGETVTETSTMPTPEAAPVVSPDQAVLASPDPEEHDDPTASKPSEQMATAEPVPDLALPPPKVENPDAPPVAIERPKPDKIEKTKTPVDQPAQNPKLLKQKLEAKRMVMRALKRAKAEAHARQMARLAQLGAPAVRAGVKDGTGEARQMSNAAYAALVSAAINRNKHYPSSARESGATGSVGVVFSISSTGAIVSHTITRSSGNSALDAEVRQMMSSTHPPPPPGGSFRGSVTISFNLGS